MRHSRFWKSETMAAKEAKARIKINTEQALVEANRLLIARFESKTKAVIDRVWGAGESSPDSPSLL